MAFLFKLETTDGVPADPPTLSSAVPNGRPATRSRWATRRWRLSVFATMTPTSRRSWSSRKLF